MAIKPGLGRGKTSKNPPILSQEFLLQNHADIIASVAMVFVVGLTIQVSCSVMILVLTMWQFCQGSGALTCCHVVSDNRGKEHFGESFFFRSQQVRWPMCSSRCTTMLLARNQVTSILLAFHSPMNLATRTTLLSSFTL